MRDTPPILLIGGSGIVGRSTAGFLRDASPDAQLLIGGRDVVKARAIATDLGNAEGVAIDLAAPDLGLGDRSVGAVIIFLKDDTLAALKFAQTRGVPHVGISSGTFEIGPEVSAFIHHPDAAPVVLGSEWLAGAATLATLEFVKRFARVDAIRIDAVLDDQDIGGPAADADMQRLTEVAPAALTRSNGEYFWRTGAELQTEVEAVDGTRMPAFGYSPHDIVALPAATGAKDVQFNVAVGLSSSRRRGEAMSTEIIISLAGEGHDGRARRSRHTIVHPAGQAPLTALGAAMMLQRLTGLDGQPASAPGLYFPEQLVSPDAFLVRLAAIGGVVTTVEHAR